MRMGMDLNYFWNLNPKQFFKHYDVFFEEEQIKFNRLDTLNYYLGLYMRLAFHNPKQYPKEPFTATQKEKKPTVMTGEDMARMAKINTMKLGGKVHGNTN